MPRTVQELETEIAAIRTEFEVELETIQARYLGKDGRVDGLLKELRDLTPGERVLVGASINSLVAFMKSRAP